MKLIIQRVSRASVSVKDKTISSIDAGLLILLGISHEDTEKLVGKMARKIVDLRIFSDENGKFNHSVKQVKGHILVVSQFTLLADTKKGNRPSFINAAPPDQAKRLYELFIEELERLEVKKVVAGEFGSHMQVELVNDGPVTIVM